MSCYFTGSTGTASDAQSFAASQPAVMLKQPPKPRITEPDKTSNSLGNSPITSPKRKNGEPVKNSSNTTDKNVNQSVTPKPTTNVTASVENCANNKSVDKNISEKDKNSVSVIDKNCSKELLEVEPKPDNKDLLTTPKRERFIPPLPKSSSK